MRSVTRPTIPVVIEGVRRDIPVSCGGEHHWHREEAAPSAVHACGAAARPLWVLWCCNCRARDGEPIEAWLGAEHFSLERVLKFVQEDIDAHRQLPFDEGRERARRRC